MQHETRASQRVAAMGDVESRHDYKKGELVVTCDGLPGKIVAVHDGPFQGNEAYEIILENNLGRGQYTSSQIKGRYAFEADPNLYTADKDYPELHEILHQRPDPAKLTFSASKVPQASESDAEGLTRISKVLALGASDPSFRMHLTAAWKDVVAKAKRIRTEGHVTIVSSSGDTVVGHVRGENNVYETGIQRTVGSNAIAAWSCGCAWGSYHWGASDDFSRFAGRQCSHSLALQYEAQSRGMFGRDVHEDPAKPKWVPKKVVVKYDIDSKNHMYSHSSLRPGDHDPALELPPLVMITGMARDDEQAQAIMKSAAVNDLFGNNPVAAPNRDVHPLGATTPRDDQENPASAGFMSGPDPSDWTNVQPSKINTWGVFDQDSTQVSSDMPIEDMAPDESTFYINQTPHGNIVHAQADDPDVEAELKDEPEAALPESTAYNWDHADPSSLSPEQIDSNGTPTPPSGGMVTSQPTSNDIPEETLSGSNSSDTMNDIIRDFHKSTAAASLGGTKTAMKDFSFFEQQELINEGRGQRARNFDQLNIEGTHYALLDEDKEDQLWLM